MTITQLARLATADLAALARNGDLSASQAWTAVKGAARYVAAVASGDVVTTTEAIGRLARCQRCEAFTERPDPVRLTIDGTPTELHAYYCGEPFKESARTCGCLLAVGQSPAGKMLVGSEQCPRGEW